MIFQSAALQLKPSVWTSSSEFVRAGTAMRRCPEKPIDNPSRVRLKVPQNSRLHSAIKLNRVLCNYKASVETKLSR